MSTLPNPPIFNLTGSLSSDRIRSPTGLQPSDSTSLLVYLTSVERVREVSLCSSERQDSLLLQGLKVAEDPLSEILTSKPSQLLLPGNRVAELTLTAFQIESGLRITQRLSPFPLDVLTNYNDPDLITPSRLVVSEWHFPLDSTWLSVRRLGNPESSHANRLRPGRYTRIPNPFLVLSGSQPNPFQSFKAQWWPNFCTPNSSLPRNSRRLISDLNNCTSDLIPNPNNSPKYSQEAMRTKINTPSKFLGMKNGLHKGKDEGSLPNFPLNTFGLGLIRKSRVLPLQSKS